MTKLCAIAVCLWGISVGLVAYRFGMLPLIWSSPWRHILPGVAIGLAFGGHGLWRHAADRGATRPALVVLIAWGVVGTLAGFGASYVAFPTLARTAITKRAMPGFELALPSGDTVADGGDYTSGNLTLKNVGNTGGLVVVQWEPATPLAPDELKAIAMLMRDQIGKGKGDARVSTLPGPDGKPVDTIVFGDDGVSFAMSMLRCGVRHVLVATGSTRDTMTLHKRIIASFVCRADPAKDATTKVTIPIVIDLPGWYASSREPDQIQVTDGLTGNLTMRTVPSNVNVPLDKLLKVTFEAAGVEVEVGANDGERVRLTLSDGGETIHGWARLFTCPRGTALVMGLGSDEGVGEALYREVKDSRCLRDGEAPQQWPDAPAGAPQPGP